MPPHGVRDGRGPAIVQERLVEAQPDEGGRAPVPGAGLALDDAVGQGIPEIVQDGSTGLVVPAGDIGVAVRFLLGDDARFVTGQTLMVDGGSGAIS